jgi:hypothetical protein
MSKRTEFLDWVLLERESHTGKFGSEMDGLKTPTEWAATISHYATEHISKYGIPPSKEDFKTSLIQAAAVVLAAYEYLDRMVENGTLVE